MLPMLNLLALQDCSAGGVLAANRLSAKSKKCRIMPQLAHHAERQFQHACAT